MQKQVHLSPVLETWMHGDTKWRKHRSPLRKNTTKSGWKREVVLHPLEIGRELRHDARRQWLNASHRNLHHAIDIGTIVLTNFLDDHCIQPIVGFLKRYGNAIRVRLQKD